MQVDLSKDTSRFMFPGMLIAKAKGCAVYQNGANRFYVYQHSQIHGTYDRLDEAIQCMEFLNSL